MAKKNEKRGIKDNELKIIYKSGITLAEFSKLINVSIKDLITKLFSMGSILNQNQVVDKDTFYLLAYEYGFDVLEEKEIDIFDSYIEKDSDSSLIKRAPVVTIMGHVDHGKTTLLDFIRKTRIANKEAGGITQHIGAYSVNYSNNLITFIDTPGHAAFSHMRQRGASITDIVVLVVAGDDGVKPQTIEAIEHAKAAKCPILVCINKIDKPTCNVDRIKEELTRFELVPEEWGGSTIFCNISAKNGDGIDNLLENIILLSDILELKANPNKKAHGVCIEASLDKFKGSIQTLLVEGGTLNIGDIVCCGSVYGRVRSIEDELNNKYKTAQPGCAFSISGLNGVCKAGDRFVVCDSDQQAKALSLRYLEIKDEEDQLKFKKKSIDELFVQEDNIKTLHIIIKTDAQGSQEALKNSLLNISVENTKIVILRSTAGTITEDDINLAASSNALIIGFNVRALPSVRDSALTKGVNIKTYNVIYNVLDDVELILKGMLDPQFEEVVTGFAEIRQIFKAGKLTIAGCYVTEGYVTNEALIRLLRSGVVVHEGKLSSLRRYKDDVKQVKQGFECGISLENFNDITVDDIIECSILEEKKSV